MTNIIFDTNAARDLFHVNDHTVNQQPFRFVTSDKTMLLASDAFHDRQNVMNYAKV